MSALDVAKSERKGYEDDLRRHLKGCLECTRARKDPFTEPCHIGRRLEEAIRLMTRQVELLTPPPQPEYVQDGLF